MTLAAALTVLAGALVGGFVSGLAGFGLGLVALGFWLHAVTPAEATALVAFCSVLAQAQTLPAIWHAVEWRRVGPMLLAGLVGVPLGALLLTRLDMEVFRLGTGLFLIAFSGFLLLVRSQPAIHWGGTAANAAVGFVGGVMGGLAGLSGPAPTAWATLRGWSKHERRGVFQPFNLGILAAVALWNLLSGAATAELALLSAVALPGTFLGALAGAAAYRRLSDRRFHEVVLVLLAFSGVTLVWAAF
ncbi:TSUP family transporter [Roseomonas elaeocarpi]|uniref:Probable membrane transporter protein n=1 Tax=Roseomonas elaeocarpi TaxID=907779 RepID=A0ABV6JSV0_9PROT